MTEPPSAVVSEPHPSGALQNAKRNLNYLLDPKKNTGPTKLSTRTLLRTARYVAKFIFWRLVRDAKYAAVGAIGAAIAGTAIGTVFSGAAFVLAPPGILAGAGVGLVWAIAKFGWRTMGRRVWRGDVEGASARVDEEVEDGHHAKSEAIKVPRMDPW